MAVTLRTFIQVSVCILGDWDSCMNRRLFCPSHVTPSSSALKSSLRHPLCRPAHHVTIALPTLLSSATSVNPVKRFRCFVRRVERRRSYARPLVRSFVRACVCVCFCWRQPPRWSTSPSLVAVVSVVSQRLIRLINETIPGPQIARVGSSRTKSEQCRYCFLTLAAPQPDASAISYFEKFNGRSS